MAERAIGLLGGSFNPAHSGHLHLSREALKRLRLDEVWWLVSPQNPLKRRTDLAPYNERLVGAKAFAARDRRIRVSDIERRWNTRYTVDTLKKLKQRFPRLSFVWLMGADNLAQFHRWRRWQQIFNIVPVAVFDRAPYSHSSLRARAALRFAGFRLRDRQLTRLGRHKAPVWGYIAMRRDPASSTEIRKLLENKRVLRHNESVRTVDLHT